MKLYLYKRPPYDLEYGKQEPIFLNNLGYYEDIRSDIEVCRPEGRPDYQLVWVSRGELEVEGRILKNGEYCVLSPHQPQHYTYRHGKQTRYYWIHFTGNRVEDYLQGEALCAGCHGGNGRGQETDTLFSSLIHAAIRDESINSAYATTLFHALLFLLASPAPREFPFLRAKTLLEDISAPVSIGDLARLYCMSAEHFIRSFKVAYGTTPTNYRIRYQLAQAKTLLSDTRLSVFSIAQACGFTEADYSSRLFKKLVGVTPSQYRKRFFI